MCESNFANCPREVFFGLGSRRHIGPQKQKPFCVLSRAGPSPGLPRSAGLRVKVTLVSEASSRGHGAETSHLHAGLLGGGAG
jgi:hypothetical protein